MMRPGARLAALAACLVAAPAWTLPQPEAESRPGPVTAAGHQTTARSETPSSDSLGKRHPMPEILTDTVWLRQHSVTAANVSLDTGRRARLFFPRRKFTKTCVEIFTLPEYDGNFKLDNILETLTSNKGMLTNGQTAILQAISNISTGACMATCDLSGLETGQSQILTEISNIDTNLDQLDDILAAIADAKAMILAGQADIGTCDLSGLESGQEQILTAISGIDTDLGQLDDIIAAIADAKDMILDGQGNINNNINDLDSDLETAKTMLLDGQSEIKDDISGLSTALETVKTMLTDGQNAIIAAINSLSTDFTTVTNSILAAITDLDGDISDISTQITNAEANILAGQTTINNNIADLSMQLTDLETTITNELTTINNKLDALEMGQEEICDKIEALDTKLDTIIDKLMEGGSDSCPEGAILSNGQCFTLSENRANFEDAAAACAEGGGTLATMTADNAAAIYGLADSVPSDMVWIGLTRESGSWAWQDGSPYGDFLDWPGAEPSSSAQQCGRAVAASSTDGDWEDQPCTSSAFYICQTSA